MDRHLEMSWAQTRRLLEEAAALITDEPIELDPFRYQLEHNELGLALDELVDIAIRRRSAISTWLILREAASSMGLSEADPIHGRAVRTIEENLHRASEWVELRRLINEWDPIGVYDAESDFPSDEYDCLDSPLMRRLSRGETPQDISEFLKNELESHFGISSAHSQPESFAYKLVCWFSSRVSGGGQTAPVAPSRSAIERVLVEVRQHCLPRDVAASWAMQWVSAAMPGVADRLSWETLKKLGGIDLRDSDGAYLYSDGQIAHWFQQLKEADPGPHQDA